IASSFEPAALAPAMVVGMACSQLESRVRSILNPRVRRDGVNGLRIWLTALGALCFLIPLSILQPWSASAASSPAAEYPAPSASSIDSAADYPGSEPTQRPGTQSSRESSRKTPIDATENASGARPYQPVADSPIDAPFEIQVGESVHTVVRT